MTSQLSARVAEKTRTGLIGLEAPHRTGSRHCTIYNSSVLLYCGSTSAGFQDGRAIVQGSEVTCDLERRRMAVFGVVVRSR